MNGFLKYLRRGKLFSNQRNVKSRKIIHKPQENIIYDNPEVKIEKTVIPEEEEVMEPVIEMNENTLKKDDFLISQIDEFREKAKQLQALLDAKENRFKELQSIVEEREDKAKELNDVLEEKQKQADGILDGVERKIDEMTAQIANQVDEMDRKFAEHLAGNAVSIIDQNNKVKEIVEEQRENYEKSVSSITEQVTLAKNEIFEKVHSEDVKCYRNLKMVLDEANQKVEELICKTEELKTVKKFALGSLIISIMSFCTMAVLVLGYMEFL